MGDGFVVFWLLFGGWFDYLYDVGGGFVCWFVVGGVLVVCVFEDYWVVGWVFGCLGCGLWCVDLLGVDLGDGGGFVGVV